MEDFVISYIKREIRACFIMVMKESQYLAVMNRCRERPHSKKKILWNHHGKWSDEENFVYLKFLLDNRHIFENKGMRKKSHIFMQMAKRLSKRSPDQCRSHHQKM